MISPKTPILIAHLVGLALALGPVMIIELRMLPLLVGARVSGRDVALVEAVRPFVLAGLGLLWLSGLGFLLFYAVAVPEALSNPKLHAKLVIVNVLTLNGWFVERHVFRRLLACQGRPLFEDDTRGRAGFLAIAAVSATGWYAPFLLGSVRELNFALGLWVFLALYLLATACLFACLWTITAFAAGRSRPRLVDSGSRSATPLSIAP